VTFSSSSQGRHVFRHGMMQNMQLLPQTKIFSHQCGGHPQPLGGKPP